MAPLGLNNINNLILARSVAVTGNSFKTREYIKQYSGVDGIDSRYVQYENKLQSTQPADMGGPAENLVNTVKNIGMAYDMFNDKEGVSELTALLLYTFSNNTDIKAKAEAFNTIAEIYSVFLWDPSLHENLRQARTQVLALQKKKVPLTRENIKGIDLFSGEKGREYLLKVAREILGDKYLVEGSLKIKLLDIFKCRILFSSVLTDAKYQDKEWLPDVMRLKDQKTYPTLDTLLQDRVPPEEQKELIARVEEMFRAPNIENIMVDEIAQVINSAWIEVITQKKDNLDKLDQEVVSIYADTKNNVTPDVLQSYYDFRQYDIRAWNRNDNKRNETLRDLKKFYESIRKIGTNGPSAKYYIHLQIRCLVLMAQLNLWLSSGSPAEQQPFANRQDMNRTAEAAIDYARTAIKLWEDRVWPDFAGKKNMSSSYFDVDRAEEYLLAETVLAEANKARGQRGIWSGELKALKDLDQYDQNKEKIEESSMASYNVLISALQGNKTKGTYVDVLSNIIRNSVSAGSRVGDCIRNGWLRGFMLEQGKVSVYLSLTRYLLAQAEIANTINPYLKHDEVEGAVAALRKDIRTSDIDFALRRINQPPEGVSSLDCFKGSWLEILFRTTLLDAWHKANYKDYLPLRSILQTIRTQKVPVDAPAEMQRELKNIAAYPQGMLYLMKRLSPGSFSILEAQILSWEKDYAGAAEILEKILNDQDKVRRLQPEQVVESTMLLLEAYTAKGEEYIWKAKEIAENILAGNDDYKIGALTLGEIREKAFISTPRNGNDVLPDVYLDQVRIMLTQINNNADITFQTDPDGLIKKGTKAYLQEQMANIENNGLYHKQASLAHKLLLREESTRKKRLRIDKELIEPDNLLQRAKYSKLEISESFSQAPDPKKFSVLTAKYPDKYHFNKEANILVVRGKMTKEERALLQGAFSASGDKTVAGKVSQTSQQAERLELLQKAEKIYRRVLSDKKYNSTANIYLYADGLARANMGLFDIARLRRDVPTITELCAAFLTVQEQVEKGQKLEIPQILQDNQVDNELVIRALSAMNFDLRALQTLGGYYKEIGDFAKANSYYDGIIARYRTKAGKLKDVQARDLLNAFGAALQAQIDMLAQERKYGDALAKLNEQIAILEKLDKNQYQTKLYYDLVLRRTGIYKDIGDWQKTEVCLNGLQKEIEQGRKNTQAPKYEQYMWADLQDSVSLTMGWLLLEQKNYADSKAAFLKVQNRYKDYGDVLDQHTFAYADALKGLVLASQNQKDFAKARLYCDDLKKWISGQEKQVITLAGRDGLEPYRRSLALVEGQMLLAEKKFPEAKEQFLVLLRDRAVWNGSELQGFKEDSYIEDKINVLQALTGLGDLNAQLGIYEAARGYYQAVLNWSAANKDDKDQTEGGLQAYIGQQLPVWNLAQARLEFSKNDLLAARQQAEAGLKNVTAGYRSTAQLEAQYDLHLLLVNVERGGNEFKEADRRLGLLTGLVEKTQEPGALARDQKYGAWKKRSIDTLYGWNYFSQGRHDLAINMFQRVLAGCGIKEVPKDINGAFIKTDDGLDDEQAVIDALKGLAVINTYAGDKELARSIWTACEGLYEDYGRECQNKGQEPLLGVQRNLNDLKIDGQFNHCHVAFQEEDYQQAFGDKGSGYTAIFNLLAPGAKQRELSEQLMNVEVMLRMAEVYKSQNEGKMALSFREDIESYINSSQARTILKGQFQEKIDALRIEAYTAQRRNNDLYAVKRSSADIPGLGQAAIDLVDDKYMIFHGGASYKGDTLEIAIRELEQKQNLDPLVRVKLRSLAQEAVVLKYKGLDASILELIEKYSEKNLEYQQRQGLPPNSASLLKVWGQVNENKEIPPELKAQFLVVIKGLTSTEKQNIITFQLARGDREMQQGRLIPEDDISSRREYFQRALREYRRALVLAELTAANDDDQSRAIGAVTQSCLVIRRLADTYSELGEDKKALRLYEALVPSAFGAEATSVVRTDADWLKELGKAEQLGSFNRRHLNAKGVTDTDLASMMVERGGIYTRNWVIQNDYPTKNYARSAKQLCLFLENKYNLKTDPSRPILERMSVVLETVKAQKLLDRKVQQSLFLIALGFTYDKESKNDDMALQILSTLKPFIEEAQSQFDLDALFDQDARQLIPVALKTPSFADVAFFGEATFLTGTMYLDGEKYQVALDLYDGLIAKLENARQNPVVREDPYQRRYYDLLLARAYLEKGRVYFSVEGYLDNANFTSAEKCYQKVLGLSDLNAGSLQKRIEEVIKNTGKPRYDLLDSAGNNEVLRSYYKKALLELPLTISVGAAAAGTWSYDLAHLVNGTLSKYMDKFSADEQMMIWLTKLNVDFLARKGNTHAGIDLSAEKAGLRDFLLIYLSKRVEDKVAFLKVKMAQDNDKNKYQDKIDKLEKVWGEKRLNINSITFILQYLGEEAEREDLVRDDIALNIIANALYLAGNLVQAEKQGWGDRKSYRPWYELVRKMNMRHLGAKRKLKKH